MNSLREMDFISTASYSCSLEPLKIHTVWAAGEFMNSQRRSLELFFVCILRNKRREKERDGLDTANCLLFL